MKPKIVIIASALVLAILIGKWIADSSDYGSTLIFTKEMKQTVKVEKDELFGVDKESIVREEGFWLGLLPPDDGLSPKTFAGVAPIGALLVLISTISVIISKKRRKKS